MALGFHGNHEEQAFLQTEYASKQPSLLEHLCIPYIKAPSLCRSQDKAYLMKEVCQDADNLRKTAQDITQSLFLDIDSVFLTRSPQLSIKKALVSL